MTGMHIVQIQREGNQWRAMVGPDLQQGFGGFGYSPAQALRELADRIEQYGWEPQKTRKPFLASTSARTGN